jgi:hypothetical protein
VGTSLGGGVVEVAAPNRGEDGVARVDRGAVLLPTCSTCAEATKMTIKNIDSMRVAAASLRSLQERLGEMSAVDVRFLETTVRF